MRARARSSAVINVICSLTRCDMSADVMVFSRMYMKADRELPTTTCSSRRMVAALLPSTTPTSAEILIIFLGAYGEVDRSPSYPRQPRGMNQSKANQSRLASLCSGCVQKVSQPVRASLVGERVRGVPPIQKSQRHPFRRLLLPYLR